MARFDDTIPLSMDGYNDAKDVINAFIADVGKLTSQPMTYPAMYSAHADKPLEWWYQKAMSIAVNDESKIMGLMSALQRARPPTSVPAGAIQRSTGDIYVGTPNRGSNYVPVGRGGQQSFGNGGTKTAIAVSPDAGYNKEVDVYDPNAKKAKDFQDKYNMRQVQGEMTKLSKNEKWSLVIGKERVIYDSEAEAVEAAKKRIKECILYHHIQEVDSDGIVQHSEDRCVGKIGYIDENTKERALFTYRGGAFASADRKSKNKLIRKDQKKGGKYYL